MSTEDQKTETQEKENSCTQTPIKLERLVFVAGKYKLMPLSIEEAISMSAKRVKILASGKRVFDTTSMEEKLRRLYNTERKPRMSEHNDLANQDIQGKNLLSEISECTGSLKPPEKRKVQSLVPKSEKRLKKH